MRARIRYPKSQWHTVEVTVKPRRRISNHDRIMLVATNRKGSKVSLEIQDRDVIALINAIADAWENEETP
ncbi:hypothetical protein [Corynebacterium vitaeruminis]|uniref:hypothetical protein n=1 Tax=Corynebacterium vitaeruminis TaxID=38305 RepID=UPI00054E1FAD|nr:hypothetical protein [Corynebacterium vitaeruminis]